MKPMVQLINYGVACVAAHTIWDRATDFFFLGKLRHTKHRGSITLWHKFSFLFVSFYASLLYRFDISFIDSVFL